MIIFDSDDDYNPIELNQDDHDLDVNDFVDENIVNLFPELM